MIFLQQKTALPMIRHHGDDLRCQCYSPLILFFLFLCWFSYGATLTSPTPFVSWTALSMIRHHGDVLRCQCYSPLILFFLFLCWFSYGATLTSPTPFVSWTALRVASVGSPQPVVFPFVLPSPFSFALPSVLPCKALPPPYHN